MILRIVLFLCAATWASAATKYVAQSAAGANDGSSAANAYSIAQLNAASPYSPAAGDTVILNGTITSTITVPTSGSLGNVITYQFAAGAKLSKAFWGTITSAAIYATGKNYITIDGAGVGIIENTANGDALANQQQSHGIYCTGVTGFTVQNLTIQNIYVHTTGAANGTPQYTTVAWKCEDSDTLDMHGCTIHDAYDAIYWPKSASGTKSNFAFYNNTVYACSTPVVIATSTSGAVINAVSIYGNDITMGANWYDPPDFPATNNHIDGFHLWGLSGGSMTNVSIYSNYSHGDPSIYCTGNIFCEGAITALIYNNIIVGNTNKPTEGYINVAYNVAGGTYQIYNNTIVGISNTSTGGNGIAFDPPNAALTVTIKNNIIKDCYVGLYSGSTASALVSDYNVFYNVGYVAFLTSSSYATLANWQASAGSPDANSKNGDPNLNGSYVPVATSSAIANGTNLAGLFTIGINPSATFPNPATLTRSATWDMGVFTVTTGGGGTGGSSLSGKISLSGKVSIK